MEAAGAALTAGLAAGAIERRSGVHGAAHSGACLNCEAVLQGEYCHMCGQPAHISRTLGDVWHDFLHGVLHFDNKAWQTLPLLAFRPGTLTHRYIHGQRARYIGPVAMFLFAVFLMFFVFSLVGSEPPAASGRSENTITSSAEAVTDTQQTIAEMEADLASARAETGPGAGAGIPGLEAGLAGVRAGLNAAQTALSEAQARDALYRRALADVEGKIAAAEDGTAAEELESLRVTRAGLLDAVAGDGAEVDSLTITENADGTLEVSRSLRLVNAEDRDTIFDEVRAREADGSITVNTGNAAWDHKIHEKLQNPVLAWYKLSNTAYKFAFLLVPLSLPFIALVFLWKKDVTLFDHAVFALYSLSFMSFLSMIAAGTASQWTRLGEGVEGFLSMAVSLAIPVHLFFQLKGGYGLGWFSALWRTFVLGLMLLFAFVMFLAVILVLGLTG